MVVAVVGFKWPRRGKAKNADRRNRNAFKSLPHRNALISIFNGGGSIFSILRRFWFCHATLIVLFCTEQKSKNYEMHFQDSLLCKWNQGEKRNCPPKSGNFTDNNFNLSK